MVYLEFRGIASFEEPTSAFLNHDWLRSGVIRGRVAAHDR
jgi:hypothetical protein